jgi:AhpD family alkylhydroperoxidase
MIDIGWPSAICEWPKPVVLIETGVEIMKERISYSQSSADAYKAMLGLETYLKHSSVEPMLAHLLKFRVSQINGCAYCLDMHSKDLRAGGETEQRLYLLDAWRESPIYTDRERAALEWAEALTLVREGHVPDEAYEKVKAQFSEKEIIDLTMVVVTINSWNRISIAFRTTAGTYQPAEASTAAS